MPTDPAEKFENLTVHEDANVGWCEATPANETADQAGNLSIFDDPERDPRAPTRRAFDDVEVAKLRTYLRENNGLPELEMCEPHEFERISRIFHRDGFVVVKNLLEPSHLQQVRDGCAEQLKKLLAIEGIDGRKYVTESKRLPHRYSYGTSSGSRQLLHDPVWASLVDLPTTTPILKTLFGLDDYALMGAGGDVCLPGAMEYQVLHIDYPHQDAVTPERIEQAARLGVKARCAEDGTLDSRSQQMILVKTPPIITINFMMSDLTTENGPIRHIPGSHAMPFSPPGQTEEPEWMRLATLVGAPAGSGVFRDSRAWHGATPNLSRQVRALPNVEYAAPWLADSFFAPSMPHEVWATLSDHGRKISKRIKSPEGQRPAGAGFMHPLADEREKAKQSLN